MRTNISKANKLRLILLVQLEVDKDIKVTSTTTQRAANDALMWLHEVSHRQHQSIMNLQAIGAGNLCMDLRTFILNRSGLDDLLHQGLHEEARH